MECNIFNPSPDNDSVLPENNTIDLTNVDLCEDCKSKLVSELIKAFGVTREYANRQL